MSYLQKGLWGALIVVGVGSLFFSWKSHKGMVNLETRSKEIYSTLFPDLAWEEDSGPELGLCGSLSGLPYADEQGIIREIKKIELEGVFAPHNASLVEDGEGYLLFFRHDTKDRVKVLGMKTPIRQKIPFTSKNMPFRTHIAAVRLDRNFKQISPVERIDTASEFSEDPRVFKAGEKLYLSYNDMQDNPMYSRTMRLAQIDPQTFKPYFIQDIDQLIHHVDQLNHIEKNWVPFIAKEDQQICFEYGINPHKIMRMKDPQASEMDHLIFPHAVSLQKMPWHKKWGAIRGGTPARLIDGDQYLAFFHTLFYEGKKPWYVMGAYTFQASAPYRVTAVSSAPILFRGIYDTKAHNTAHSSKHAIYPAGLALGEEEGRKVAYVSCGENDCAVKVLTFDIDNLLQSLTQVPLYEVKKTSSGDE